ncbi:Proteasome subunit beta type-6 [Vitis vinifera]|uniref:Proteasome subunit beta type-6 n=1 Tax=Vitis vinifera TaxID=29760 RepID=A0A438HWB9_VITVI|nr:Proteasome subunit beta type-6 [Vitis vinifera]
MDYLNQPHSMGTTIIGVTYNGGVVLGADSRTSTGSTSTLYCTFSVGVYVANRASDKITQLTDNVYLCRSGSAADSQILSDYVRYYLHQHTHNVSCSIQLGQPATVKVAANLVRLISYNNKERNKQLYIYFHRLIIYLIFGALFIYLLNFEQNMLQTGLIVGGWDKHEGGKIYGVPLGGTILEQPLPLEVCSHLMIKIILMMILL